MQILPTDGMPPLFVARGSKNTRSASLGTLNAGMVSSTVFQGYLGHIIIGSKCTVIGRGRWMQCVRLVVLCEMNARWHRDRGVYWPMRSSGYAEKVERLQQRSQHLARLPNRNKGSSWCRQYLPECLGALLYRKELFSVIQHGESTSGTHHAEALP